jgi:multiple sugar transport system substrate-binding protein
MEEIVFSIGNRGLSGMENLKTLLLRFEQEYGIHVRLDTIPLSSMRWSSLVEAALYHAGPDVSEVGNSWVGDLVRMDALRPFLQREIDIITAGAHFFESVWKSSVRESQGEKAVFSIPWSSDARSIFFRRDLLEKAGIDEKIAFSNFDEFEKTIAQLYENNQNIALALPTRRSNMTLQIIASWIWGEGGAFLSPDGLGLAFDDPKALAGCRRYFELSRFLGLEATNLEEFEADDAFGNGKAAVLLSGFWVPTNNLAEIVYKNIGAAPMPGIPFVGGAHLVVWRHSRHEQACLKLIEFFHTKESAQLLYPWFGLPISEDGWSTPPFNSEIYQVFRKSIQVGRGFPTARLWGLVEKRLTDTLADIWADIVRQPGRPLASIVEAHLTGLARRLKLTLEF